MVETELFETQATKKGREALFYEFSKAEAELLEIQTQANATARVAVAGF